ncbi:MAG: hypothetical protein IPM47_20635 [Sphingobacteriales bacterium]|nr:MAG: hypothetical protein IPM47_20635 [Sphingobacteriales bacterium]
MQFTLKSVLFLIFQLALFSFTNKLTPPIQKLKADITTKQVRSGKSSTVKAELYYTSGGKLITHFTQPREYVLVTNNKGEYKIYDPNKNTVEQNQSEAFSTDITYFGHFLNNRTTDMGLRNLGFTLYNTRFETNATVTEWQPQLVDRNTPVFVELVHENSIPIFIGYKEWGGKYLRKVFFYNYQKIQHVNLPATITDINYLENNDSIVSRTNYSNILVNEQAKGSYFDFQIPANAKLK